MNPVANNKNSKKNYSSLSKEDLIKIVEKLESRKKYGLIWDEDKVKEQFERETGMGGVSHHWRRAFCCSVSIIKPFKVYGY